MFLLVIVFTLLVVTEDVREETERRLRALSRAGRLAEWRGEHGDGTEPPGRR